MTRKKIIIYIYYIPLANENHSQQYYLPLTDSSKNSDILSVSVESDAVANMNSPATSLNDECRSSLLLRKGCLTNDSPFR